SGVEHADNVILRPRTTADIGGAACESGADGWRRTTEFKRGGGLHRGAGGTAIAVAQRDRNVERGLSIFKFDQQQISAVSGGNTQTRIRQSGDKRGQQAIGIIETCRKIAAAFTTVERYG